MSVRNSSANIQQQAENLRRATAEHLHLQTCSLMKTDPEILTDKRPQRASSARDLLIHRQQLTLDKRQSVRDRSEHEHHTPANTSGSRTGQ